MRIWSLMVLFVLAVVPAGARAQQAGAADRVIVYKHKHVLQLLHGGAVLRSYRVSLGLQPEGHKERSGDFRTPEGSYRLTRRNVHSEYFLSVQVSYPNALDINIAHRNGWKVGGSIMVHGLPNALKRPVSQYVSRDWTDGCIALSNADMLEFWQLTGYDTPIDIYP